MVIAYYVVRCLNIKMNILTRDDKIHIYNLGEFIIGGATCPPIMDLQPSFLPTISTCRVFHYTSE